MASLANENGSLAAAAVLAASAGPRSGEVIREALSAIRRHLGMEIAYFSEFVDGRSVFRHVDAPGHEDMIKAGDSHSLDDVYCNHILEGRLPELIPDTADEPIAAAMAITTQAPIGSHASIPIRHPDGRPYGMFCCLSALPNHTLNLRDLETMRVFAALAARELHVELEESRVRDDKRDAVEAVIAREAFAIAYQPIVDLATMEVVSFEALARFSGQPYRGPDRWFADADEVGLGAELELAAIRASLKGFKRLPDTMTLSVNVSPAVVLDPRFVASLDGAPLKRTIIEITEHAKVADYGVLHEALEPLRERGVRVAVDDAGAGYSGLQHIVQMSPHLIKMDMSLTRGIDRDSARRALASAMVYYARETGATVVAEGIETAKELATLRTLGIGRGQGYFIGRPGELPSEF